jgi:hypothetical protein
MWGSATFQKLPIFFLQIKKPPAKQMVLRKPTHFSQTFSLVVAEFPNASPYRGWWLNYNNIGEIKCQV